MDTRNSFLSANWEHLILVNYEIHPDVLKPYVPEHTVLDVFENRYYISLVGFMFKNTKVLGVKLPLHVNFEEVNLRFYVKHKNTRGVVFIKEIVPKPLITFVANSLYNEHYETSKMSHVWDTKNNYIEYSWEQQNKRQHISVTSEELPKPITPYSEEDFILEHYYGYTKYKNKTFQYEVQHPQWLHYPIKEYTINVDFEMNYGKEFSFLNTRSPSSVILAKGSKIHVMPKNTIAAK
ncbi:YqjF family protein [Seonamhaeicola marinus]|uniref:DUF2071 domain-containing protein n=1 Tax=Seonamhaeicola marinus TaxID=1912246 RepID=A0A5D0HEV9_9FLAO|nr:DUF2071 domain-containing protein [Seonamhaeicola marinus]TYA69826.1 DUF2071 domain-containing protein [Seonamhaeicola marinus]